MAKASHDTKWEGRASFKVAKRSLSLFLSLSLSPSIHSYLINCRSFWGSFCLSVFLPPRLIFWSLLRGQILRSLTPQTSRQTPRKQSCNTGGCQEKGLWHWEEIWPPGCGMPKGSQTARYTQTARYRHLASHSPVPKSLGAEILTFVHFWGCFERFG